MLDRVTARPRLTAFDADGDTVYGAARPRPKQPTDDDALMAALRRRYKFSDAASTGVPLARLRALLARVAPERAVARFVRRHFHARTEARRAGTRRLVVCRPRTSRGLLLVK